MLGHAGDGMKNSWCINDSDMVDGRMSTMQSGTARDCSERITMADSGAGELGALPAGLKVMQATTVGQLFDECLACIHMHALCYNFYPAVPHAHMT